MSELEKAHHILDIKGIVSERKGIKRTLPERIESLIIVNDMDYVELQETIESLQQQLEELKAASRWIPVSERLPSRSVSCVLLINNSTHKSYETDTYFPNSGWALHDRANITHWKPIGGLDDE